MSSRMSTFWIAMGLGLTAPFVTSCVTKKEKSEETTAEGRLTEEQHKQLEDARAEMEIGRNMAGRLLKFYGAYQDEKLVRYVNEVGLYVAKFSEFPERRYMFDVYNSDAVNAFACPGGYILISLGAVKNASNEAELAHVLGHEIAHVGKKHMFNTLAKMSKDELDKTAEEGAKAAPLPEEVVVRKRPAPEENVIGALIARYLSGSAAGLNVLQAAKAGMSLVMEKGLGSDLEYEADREGTHYAINAGYYPKALVNFLCRIEVNKGKPKDYCLKPEKMEAKADGKSVLERTHPPIPERVANIKTVLIAVKADDIIGAKGKKRFAKIKERLNGGESRADKDGGDDDETTGKE